MRKFHGRVAAATLVAISALSIVGAGPAQADPVPVDTTTDGIPIWDESDEIVVPDGTPGLGSYLPDDPQPRVFGRQCDATYATYVTNNVKNDYVETFRTSTRNSTDESVPFDVEVTETGTVEYGLSVNVEEELKAGIFAKVAASINGSVKKSMSTSYGLKVHPTVKPHHKMTVQYGIYREKFSWRRYRIFSNCHETTLKQGTGWAPYDKEFRITTAKI